MNRSTPTSSHSTRPATSTRRSPIAILSLSLPAIAPHLAAAQAGVAVDLAVVAAAYARLASRCDVVVVEGAGGVLVPVDATRDMLDIAATLHLPVVLVVGMRLGCLNHALLSAAAIHSRGLPFAGWVANCVDPQMRAVEANVETLSARLPAPRIATIPWGASPVLSPTAILELAM